MATTQVNQPNKDLVRDFYTLAFVHKEPEEAARKYLGATYTQHNPAAADGADAFKAFAKGFFASAPGLKVEIKRILADGDLVAVHSRFEPAPGKAMAVADFFRVENGRIVEHWDVMQDVPKDAANANTMF